MTCIVGIIDRKEKKVYIGGDSASVTPKSSYRRPIKLPKVFKRGDFLFGCCGSFRAMQLLRHTLSMDSEQERINLGYKEEHIYDYLICMLMPRIRDLFDKHRILEDTDEGAIRGESFIIGFKDQLFHIQTDFSVIEYNDDYTSVGSGAKFSLGSLHTTRGSALDSEERIDRALEAASHFNGGVIEPYIILATDGNI